MSIKKISIFASLIFFIIYSSIFAEAYTWKSVISGGGGFVPGIIYHPAESGLIYARTDMGGAYRWNNPTSQWIPITDSFVRTNADNMGILSLAIDPNDTDRVYMETGKYTQSWAGNGVFCSSINRGATWTTLTLPFKVGGNENGRGTGERLVVDPNLGSTLLMGSTFDGMYKSINYGASWSKVAGGFTPTNVNFIIYDKASGTLGSYTPRIYAGVSDTTGQSLWSSIDGGTNWTVVAGQPNGVMAFRADIVGGNMYMTFCNNSGPNYSPASGSVWKYNIAGGTWQNISPIVAGYGFGGVSVDALNNNNLVVSTLGNWGPQDEIWRSTNGGTSWTALLTNATWDRTYSPWTINSLPHWASDVKIDPYNSNKAIFVTGYGIWKTDNLANMANTTWYFNDNIIEETVPLQIISPASGAHLLTAMGDIDGFRHDDLDVSPAQRYLPTRGTTLSIAFAENVPLKIVKGFNNTNYGSFSIDGGTTWTYFPTAPSGTTGGGSRAIAISANGTNIVWMPAGVSGPYFSSNDGTSWAASTGGAPTGYEPVADRVNSNKFYMFNGVTGYLWVSLNGGQSFAQGALVANGGVDSWATSDGVAAAAPGNDGHVWITTGRNGLYRSTDSGASASKVASVTEAYRIGFGMAKSGNPYPAIFVYGIIAGNLGFYRSDDTGATWNRINDVDHQYGYVHQIIGDPRIYGRCYISAEGRGAFYGDILAAGTATFTPTNTSSYTFTPTLTRTNTKTATSTATLTLSITPSSSFTNTPTSTPTKTNTIAVNSPTNTFTQTDTKTSTLTLTATGTNTIGNSPTNTRTPSFTFTFTPTNSWTSTGTLTFTYTPTKTISPTRTETNTHTVSPTETIFNGSPTDSPTVTVTATVTETAIATSCTCGDYAGYNIVGTYGEFNDSQVFDSNKITLKEAGIVTSLSMHVTATGGGQIVMALYDDNNGAPGNLIQESSPQASVTGWNLLDITDSTLSAGTYWIAFQVQIGVTITVDTGISGDERWAMKSFGGFDPVMGATNAYGFVYSVKANYCPITCAPVPTPIPLCVCPDELGLNYPAASTIAPANFAIANWYGITEDGVTSSMEIYIASGTGQARLAIYANSLTTTATGQPDLLIAESAPFSVVTGWNTVTIPQTLLKAWTVYWIAFQSAAGVNVLRETGTTGDMYYRAMPFENFPGKFTNANSQSENYSMHINYCPVSCPPTITPTPTITETSSATPTFTYSFTVTATPTNSINSPTVTQTLGNSATITQTSTIVINTPTNTFTSTITATEVNSSTSTATYSQTVTVQSPTNTPVITSTYSNTFTSTQTVTATQTQSIVNTPTLTITLTPQAVATAPAIAIKDILAHPNPYYHSTGGSLIIKATITRDTKEITFKLYTSNSRLVRKFSINPVTAGIKNLIVNSQTFDNLSCGVYFYTIEVVADNNTKAKSKIDKVIILK